MINKKLLKNSGVKGLSCKAGINNKIAFFYRFLGVSVRAVASFSTC